MASPRVSILLPTYNRGAYISNCIETVIHQHYDDWELIILDDCSSDTTREVCETYVQSHDNIFYHRKQTRGGTPANRNTGLGLARGNLVFFIEDDILLDTECLSILVETFDNLIAEGRRIGGVIPRLINEGMDEPPATECEPFVMDPWTGEVWNNYSIICDRTIETFTAHACTLYSKEALEAVGNYSTVYSGNFFREETEPPMKMSMRGYGLFFQSRAIALHKRYRTGSYYGASWLSSQWQTTRNHLVFTVRVFGLRSTYMIPCYLCKVLLRGAGVLKRRA